MRIIFFTILLFTNFKLTLAQLAPVFDWRDHLTYSQVNHVALANNKVYAASSSGMFFVDLEDNSIQRFGTVDGLNDVVATAMNSSLDKKFIYIGHEDGSFDILEDKTIHNIYDISRSSLVGNKQINHFNFYSNSTCFISTGFGIIAYNVEKKEVIDTYLIGANGAQIFVNSTFVGQDTLYAATETGLYKGSLKSFLSNPTNWSKDYSYPNSNSNLSMGVSFGGNIHVNTSIVGYSNDTVYTKIDTGWTLNTVLSGNDNHSFDILNNNLLVANSTSIEVWDTNWVNIRREYTFNGKTPLPRTAIFGDNKNIWVGDNFLGLVQNKAPFQNIEYLLDGPVSNKAFRINSFGGNIYVSGGGHSDLQIRTELAGEISKFSEGEWTLFDRNTINRFDTITDIITISENPLNSNQFAAASMSAGCVIFKNNKVEHSFTGVNSPLTPLIDNVTYVTGVDYDNNGTLWMSNSLSRQPIHAYSQSGTWVSFTIGDQSKPEKTNQVVATNWGDIWFIIPAIGLGVLDYNQTINSPADDRYLELTAAEGGGALPSNEVTRIAEDFDGHMWVGTNAGIGVFYNASNIIDASDKDAKEIFIDQDGQTQILLKDQFVTDIFIDPANRKWISTRGNGVYLMSPDGSEEIRHFTVENSPLFSNEVTSVAADGKTGEVFFGTVKGIISFRETATESSDFSSMYAFPNPVLPRYSGVIAINGIADQSTVIITDVSGNKVFESTSNGGQATWDATNLNGDRVASGVYLIYAVSSDGNNNGVTKILIEN